MRTRVARRDEDDDECHAWSMERSRSSRRPSADGSLSSRLRMRSARREVMADQWRFRVRLGGRACETAAALLLLLLLLLILSRSRGEFRVRSEGRTGAVGSGG